MRFIPYKLWNILHLLTWYELKCGIKSFSLEIIESPVLSFLNILFSTQVGGPGLEAVQFARPVHQDFNSHLFPAGVRSPHALFPRPVPAAHRPPGCRSKRGKHYLQVRHMLPAVCFFFFSHWKVNFLFPFVFALLSLIERKLFKAIRSSPVMCDSVGNRNN